ncbi:hypothetical protein M513_00460, partial [Trichuris suis]
MNFPLSNLLSKLNRRHCCRSAIDTDAAVRRRRRWLTGEKRFVWAMAVRPLCSFTTLPRRTDVSKEKVRAGKYSDDAQIWVVQAIILPKTRCRQRLTDANDAHALCLCVSLSVHCIVSLILSFITKCHYHHHHHRSMSTDTAYGKVR